MAQGDTRTYRLANVLISIDGLPLSGFGESDAITFTPRSDLFESVTGADGEVTRSASNDLSQDIALVLMQTSPALALLEARLALIRVGAPGDIFTIYVNDIEGRETVLAQQTWIQRAPDLAFGKAAAEREWALMSPNVIQSRY